MKISLFTGSQLRHNAFAATLAGVGELSVIMETTDTVENYNNRSVTSVYSEYMSKMKEVERDIFDEDINLANLNIKKIPFGSLSVLPYSELSNMLDADIYIVFGASYIRNWLADYLISRKALNLHLGMAPYYKGSACNFWALYDEKPEYVGATIHLLDNKLDNGDILYHVRPELGNKSPGQFTMSAVKVSQQFVASKISDESLLEVEPIKQDHQGLIRYSKNLNFTDEVIVNFNSKKMDNAKVKELLEINSTPNFIRLNQFE